MRPHYLLSLSFLIVLSACVPPAEEAPDTEFSSSMDVFAADPDVDSVEVLDFEQAAESNEREPICDVIEPLPSPSPSPAPVEIDTSTETIAPSAWLESIADLFAHLGDLILPSAHAAEPDPDGEEVIPAPMKFLGIEAPFRRHPVFVVPAAEPANQSVGVRLLKSFCEAPIPDCRDGKIMAFGCVDRPQFQIGGLLFHYDTQRSCEDETKVTVKGVFLRGPPADRHEFSMKEGKEGVIHHKALKEGDRTKIWEYLFRAYSLRAATQRLGALDKYLSYVLAHEEVHVTHMKENFAKSAAVANSPAYPAMIDVPVGQPPYEKIGPLVLADRAARFAALRAAEAKCVEDFHARELREGSYKILLLQCLCQNDQGACNQLDSPDAPTFEGPFQCTWPE